jgi:hypothetical protein
MFDGKLDVLHEDEAVEFTQLFPHSSPVTARSSFSTISSKEPSDLDRPPKVKLSDFIKMDDSESDSELDEPFGAPDTSPGYSDPFKDHDSSHIGNSMISGSGLLDHFEQCRGVVGSFRRNQHHAKHLSSLSLHPATRASASEYNALQKGRRGGGNVPMTPARKQRGGHVFTPGSGHGVRKLSYYSPVGGKRSPGSGRAFNGSSPSARHQTLTRNLFN